MANPAETLLYGIDSSLIDNNTHVSVGVTVETAGDESTLMVEPQTEKLTVALLGPVSLDITRLVDFIKGEKLTLGDHQKLLDDKVKEHQAGKAHVLVRCKALFYEKLKASDAPPPTVLMLFSLETDDGSDIIGSFIKNPEVKAQLGGLFQLKGVSLRILRCSPQGLQALQVYVNRLKGETIKLPAPQEKAKVQADRTGGVGTAAAADDAAKQAKETNAA